MNYISSVDLLESLPLWQEASRSWLWI